MKGFAVMSDEEVVHYKRFHWRIKRDGVNRLFCRLIGILVSENRINPMYKPLLSIEKSEEKLCCEIHLSKYKSLLCVFDQFGIHIKQFDIRKDV